MQHRNLMVVDIETIPDADHHEGDKFPALPFHQVVAIGFLEAEIHRSDEGEEYVLKELRCGGEAGFKEKQLLEGFFQYFERSKPRLVTFNGRGFDLPVLKYRAMKHGVRAPWLYHGGDRFNSYGYRFNTEWHCDLMDALTDFGASKAAKLNELAKLFGFPGKLGIDGSKVQEVYEADSIEEIRNYCETDVLNTYLVYLRFMLHRADLSPDHYNKALSEVIAFIEAEMDERPHLGEFLGAWAEAGGGSFIL